MYNFTFTKFDYSTMTVIKIIQYPVVVFLNYFYYSEIDIRRSDN